MPGPGLVIMPTFAINEIFMADEPLVIETGVHKPDACVIWLHGLGADGHDFEPIVPDCASIRVLIFALCSHMRR